MSPNSTVKTPLEMFHDAQLGNYELTKTEYRGSDHAREWALEAQADEIAQQPNRIQQQSAPAGKTRL